jgi:hypothetical protein
MAQIDAKEFRRILTTLDELGWRIEHKANKKAALCYPLDKSQPPVHVFECKAVGAKGVYQALRRHGIELEPTRGTGRVKKAVKSLVTAGAPQPQFSEKEVDPIAKPAEVPEDLDAAEARKWKLSRHLLKRVEERQFHIHEVMAAILHPELVYPSEVEPGVEMRQRGDCLVAVNPATYSALTVADVNKSRSGGKARTMVKAKPEPEPPPEPAVTTERLVTDGQIQGLVARIRSAKAPESDNINWGKANFRSPGKVPAPRRGPLPTAWIYDVVLPKLRDRPNEWARLTIEAGHIQALATAKLLQEYHDGLEIAVRDEQLYLRWRERVRIR